MAKNVSVDLATEYIVRGKALDKLVDNLNTAATTLKAMMHKGLVSAAVHVIEHGDVRPLNRLCEIAKNVSHNNAANVWANKFAAVSWDKDTKGFKVSDNKRKAALADTNKAINDLLAADKYYNMTKVPTFTPLKIMSVIEAAINRYDNMSPEDKANTRNDFTGLDEARDLLRRLKNLPKVSTGGAAGTTADVVTAH